MAVHMGSRRCIDARCAASSEDAEIIQMSLFIGQLNPSIKRSQHVIN
jgi:hypothetical protein